nr:amidase family protein [Burkholderia ubonensis]
MDFAPFVATARLLYEGPWVAERFAAIGAFIAQQPDAVHPVIREIVGGASRFTAADAFAAFDRLATLRVDAERAWDGLDAIVMPTSATTATVGALEADPIRVNARFGYYTNFVNLLDLSAIAVPAGTCATGPHAGLPFGITFVGPRMTTRCCSIWRRHGSTRRRPALPEARAACPGRTPPQLPTRRASCGSRSSAHICAANR